MVKHKNSRDIILSIVQFAKSLDMTVLAEYVDSEEKRSMLHEIGCDNYQGYLYSPAVFLK
ncbi:MAG: EAL domain-containing protein [Lachnospiraceae bacterium]|nr:EAL domain-containing protein [Lachnospiraceae bacterium]